jgi:hypothetical protein
MIYLNFAISSKTTFKRIYIYNIFLYHMSAVTRKINSKNKGGVRPKKCHNCQKFIASNKYVRIPVFRMNTLKLAIDLKKCKGFKARSQEKKTCQFSTIKKLNRMPKNL